MNAIHARGLRSRHIPHGAMRSSLRYLITCKHCQRMKGYATMDNRDVRRMVSMIRAVRAGKWTAELPSWAPPNLHNHPMDLLQNMDTEDTNDYRAVQTAEAFILLIHSSGLAFDETKFLQDCGFVVKS